MNAPTLILMDVDQHAGLPFPRSLPEFQRLFPGDAACAEYLEKVRWGDGFVCPHCGVTGEPFRISTRPGVLACRNCRRQTGLTVGTVMERSHTPLSTWFWAAYLVASQTQGMSAVQFQRQLGLTRYETAFQILHKLRAGMVRPHQDRIGGRANEHVEVDETWIGGRTRGEGRGVHHKVLVACAVEVRHRKPGTARDKRNDGRYAGRVRLAVAADRSAKSLCGFVDGAVAPGTLIVTDDWSGYADLRKRGYDHHAIAECGDSEVTDEFLPIIHLVFANLKTWLIGILTGSANGIYKPTSTNSRFGSTGASTRSTPSVRCSASLATQRRRPMPSFIPATGITLHLEGECVNRIGVIGSSCCGKRPYAVSTMPPSTRSGRMTMTTVQQVLDRKGSEVWYISPDATVFDAIARMAEKDVGSLAVMDGDELVGVITERHYARNVFLKGRASPKTLVRDVIEEQVFIARPEQSVAQCMALMTDKHVRHLPVVDGKKLIGIISIGDLVKSIIGEQEFTIGQLEHYIHGQR